MLKPYDLLENILLDIENGIIYHLVICVQNRYWRGNSWKMNAS